MEELHIWVDADSCPFTARKIVLKNAKNMGLRVSFVANRDIPFAIEDEKFNMIICPQTPGAADDYIFDNVQKNDLVITRDIPLAKRLIDKNIATINDRGTIFDKNNIQKMLRERELNLQMTALGITTGGKSRNTYSSKDIQAFANSLNSELSRLKIQCSLTH